MARGGAVTVVMRRVTLPSTSTFRPTTGNGAGSVAAVAEVLRWEERPKLRRPVLVAAFEGWNDAGDGASAAAGYLARRWAARQFACIDPEEFFDYTSVRPQVRIEGEGQRVIDWPETAFSWAPLGDTGRDVVFLRGVEPQLRWRSFTGLILDVAQELGVELVVIL